jgi:hypothetical protein
MRSREVGNNRRYAFLNKSKRSGREGKIKAKKLP